MKPTRRSPAAKSKVRFMACPSRSRTRWKRLVLSAPAAPRVEPISCPRRTPPRSHGCVRLVALFLGRPMCRNSRARPRLTIWSTGGPTTPTTLRARRAAAAVARPRLLPPAVRHSVSAPTPEAAFVFAHYCGLAAIKPTSGRVPRTGQFPMPLGARNPVFHVSLIARKVQDLALALPIISGPDFRDHSIMEMPLGDPTKVVLRDLKVAYFDDDGVAAPTKEIVAAVRDSAKAFADAGVKVEESRLPDAAKPGGVYFDISRGDGGAGTRGFLKSIGTNEISPMFERALAVAVAPAMANATEALSAFVRWDLFRNSMLRFIENYDALLSPVMPYPALLHGTGFDDDKRIGFGYAQMHNLTGWPSATVRIGTSPEGLPIGVQVAARPWREDVALALVQHLEQTFGGWRMPPSI